MRPVPKELPANVSLSSLCWMLGVTAQRVSQLERAGIVERVARGRYATTSIPNAIAELRRSREEPAAYSAAKTKLMQERAAAARSARLEAEGKSPFVAQIQQQVEAFCTYLKTRLLAQPSRMAPQLVNIPTPAQVFEILMNDMRDMLSLIGGGDGKKDLETWWEKTGGGTVDENAKD